jgi:hypothetical protein
MGIPSLIVLRPSVRIQSFYPYTYSLILVVQPTRLLKKRVRKTKVEYFVEWKGRPKKENSWEKEATISRERITEFEASCECPGTLHEVTTTKGPFFCWVRLCYRRVYPCYYICRLVKAPVGNRHLQQITVFMALI